MSGGGAKPAGLGRGHRRRLRRQRIQADQRCRQGAQFGIDPVEGFRLETGQMRQLTGCRIRQAGRLGIGNGGLDAGMGSAGITGGRTAARSKGDQKGWQKSHGAVSRASRGACLRHGL